jgi:hypothetical protein
MARRKLRTIRESESRNATSSKGQDGGPFEKFIGELVTSLNRNVFVQ